MVRFLLEQGADPTIKDKTGRTALKIAKLLKREKTIEEVLKDEEIHIETLAKVLNQWKEIYHNLPSGTGMFCHDFSTLH